MHSQLGRKVLEMRREGVLVSLVNGIGDCDLRNFNEIKIPCDAIWCGRVLANSATVQVPYFVHA